MVAELPSDMILFPRRVFYVQAALYLVVAVAAFGAGYAIGRGSRQQGAPDHQEELAQHRVPVEGRASYDDPQAGHALPDEGAVFLCLPVGGPQAGAPQAGAVPAHHPSAEGLAPSDQPPSEGDAAVRAIREMGGAYARADRSGQFMTYVPERGKYYVLIVSCHATRIGKTPTEEDDLAKLEEYLDQANRLIRGRQYRWTQEELRLDRPPLDVTFSPDRAG
jgi:hypothetical protein